MSKKYYFPAVFSKEDGGMYSVRFPDIPGCNTCGNDLNDAIIMAEDALSLMLSEYERNSQAIPSPSRAVECMENEFVNIIACDSFETHDNKVIYPAIFTPFENEGGYTVEFPDLPGCVTEGDSLVEALEMAADAACGWLLDELEDGKKLPKSTSLNEIKHSKGSFVNLMLLDLRYKAE